MSKLFRLVILSGLLLVTGLACDRTINEVRAPAAPLQPETQLAAAQ